MTESTPPLRVVWAPNGQLATPTSWFPDALIAPPTDGIGDIVKFSPEATVSVRSGIVEATWRDRAWQAALREEPLTITVTPDEMRIGVPAEWRAHAYFSWQDGHLLISSDLRTIAAAVPGARPSMPGIAAFLAGSRSAAGYAPSLYDDIWEIQPAHEVVIDARAGIRCRRTWTPEQREDFGAETLATAVGRVRVHLDELAERILARHERVACLFSGGLDSTLIAATLMRRAPKQVVLFNVGSGLGTSAEEVLRQRFLRDFSAVSHAVDLSPEASLIWSLRATNANAPLPIGSLFAHVFEEIITEARRHGCDAIATGDGGDEVFSAREEILVDLLASRSRALPAAAGHFALRNGERGTRTVARAKLKLSALRDGVQPGEPPSLMEPILGADLAQLVLCEKTAAEVRKRQLWEAGWTWSGIGSYRRAADVPRWEPSSANTPGFPVVSPLVDATMIVNALALRRDAVIADVPGVQPKWLLRQAALDWLAPEIAMHPKIGSADGQILARMRTCEFHTLLELLGSSTARSLGLAIANGADDPSARLWHSDGWIGAAALVAWFDRTVARRPSRPVVTLKATPEPAGSLPLPGTAPHQLVRPARWRAAAVACLNLVVQLLPPPRIKARRSDISAAGSAAGNPLASTLADLARRACALPMVTGSSEVMVRALAWYLRLTGTRAWVQRGPLEGGLARRYWIEVDGLTVDVSGAETPLVAESPTSEAKALQS